MSNTEEIKDIVDDLIQTYRSVAVSGRLTTPQVINYVDAYYKSEFTSGQVDSEGFRKYFFNVTKPRIDIASKQLDFDTKDVRVVAEEGADPDVAFLFQHELRQWMKEYRFGKVINDIVRDCPKYGTAFVKKAGKSVVVVNPKNLIFDPEAESIENSALIERHFLTPSEVRSQPWVTNQNREFVEEVIARNDGRIVVVFECYKPDKNGTWYRYFLTGQDSDSMKKMNMDVYETGIKYEVLAKDTISALPYKQVNYETIFGRLLGLGVAEQEFEAQVRVNEAINLQAKALQWKAKQLYQTRDEVVQKNLLSDVVNGDIIRVNSEITPVGKDNSDLVAFREEIERWEAKSKELAFATEVTSGEALPSRTPFRSTALLAQAAGSHFEFKREAIAFLIKEIISDWLIPQFRSDTRKEHLLTFVGGDRDRVDRWVADGRLLQGVMNSIRKGGFPPLEEIRAEQIRAQLEERSRPEQSIKIPEGWYDALKYRVDITISGESVDLGAKNVFLQTVLNIVGTNPAVLQNPAFMSILQRLGDINNVSLETLNVPAEPEPQIPQNVGSPPKAVGGGLTAPNSQTL